MEKFLRVDRPTLDRQKVFPTRELRMFRMSMTSENVHVKSMSNVFHQLRVICPQVFPQLISNPMLRNLIFITHSQETMLYRFPTIGDRYNITF